MYVHICAYLYIYMSMYVWIHVSKYRSLIDGLELTSLDQAPGCGRVASQLGSPELGGRHRFLETTGKPWENGDFMRSSGIYPLVTQHKHGTSQFFMGKLTRNGNFQ